MKKIKIRYIWISVAICFLLAVGLIIGVQYTKGNWTNVFIVLIAIAFIYMTIAIQFASAHTFKYKRKPINYPKASYTFEVEGVEDRLKENGYKRKAIASGVSFLKIINDIAFKVVLIKDLKEYFEPSEDEKEDTKPNRDLEKCKKFVGVELFLKNDEELLKKLPDFSFQGENVYYTGLYYDENNKQVCCPNYIEPNESFVANLALIHQDLGLQIIEEENL